MFLTAVIVDDEQKGIDGISILINRYVKDLRIIGCTTIASDAIKMIENYKPDIVFLDINMPEMNGFELLDKLEWRDFNLVFTTAHEEYALKAIKAKAFDYLLKPIDHEDLSETINRIKNNRIKNEKNNSLSDYENLFKNINSEAKDKILVISKAGIESLDITEIICLESQSNYTKIYLNNSQTIISTKTLKEFDIMLCATDQNFMRVHHSYIINLQKVARFLPGQDNVIMSDNQKIPVSKRRKEQFFKWLSV
ncbi:MAG: response regulator transcription factor [Bacteroidetes bacterium]|nr:response regulator transcription factor [Bacteroidota bacterium]